MAGYVATVQAAAIHTALTVTSTSGKQAFIRSLHYGKQSTSASTIERVIGQRSSGGVTATSRVEKFSSRSGTNGVPGQSWGTGPTVAGNPLIIVNCGDKPTLQEWWRPPRPNACPQVIDAEQFSIDTNSGSNTSTVWSMSWGESPPSDEGRAVRRRTRKAGLWHYSSHAMVIRGGLTANPRTNQRATYCAFTPRVTGQRPPNRIALTAVPGAFSGDATSTATASGTAAGVVGKVGAATSTETASGTPTGVVARSTGSTFTETATNTAAGTVGAVGNATQTETSSGTATGSVVAGGVTGDATLTETATSTAAGIVAAQGNATLTETASNTTAGVVGKTTGATSTITATNTATGVVAIFGNATLTETAVNTAAAGAVAISTITATNTATGAVGTVGAASSTATASGTASAIRGTVGAATSTAAATQTAAALVSVWGNAFQTAAAASTASGSMAATGGATLTVLAVHTADGIVTALAQYGFARTGEGALPVGRIGTIDRVHGTPGAAGSRAVPGEGAAATGKTGSKEAHAVPGEGMQ